jgi:hypothetical protein
MNWEIAIPSYNRANILKEKTLALLERHDILPARIRIFVANQEQFEEYSDLLPSYNIVIGCPGISSIRNFITNYYVLNQPVVQIDDDIEEIYELVDNKLEPVDDLISVINKGFALCIAHKKNLWGIYPTRNKFFMKESYSTGLAYCIGQFFGYYNQHIPVSLMYREDYERSLLYAVKDSGVIRMNDICCKTKNGSGGIGVKVKDRIENSEAEVNQLIKVFGPMVQHNIKRRGELLLKHSIFWK